MSDLSDSVATSPSTASTCVLNPENLYLYTLVRTDLASMGRGRAAAQIAHAATDFTDTHIIQPLLAGRTVDPHVLAWRAQAGTFGTQIVLAVPDLAALRTSIDLAKRMGFDAALVVDPEYAVPDGSAFHMVVDLITTGYIFGRKPDLRPLLSEMPMLLNDPVDVTAQYAR